MNEVKSPKKPLIYYYMIVVLLVLLFNLLAMPWLAEHQIKEVDYNTFVSMTEKNEIGQVEIQQQSNRILFTSTDGKTIYKTAIVPDDGLVQRLLDAGVSTTGEEIEQTSLLTDILGWVLPLVIFIAIGQIISRSLMKKMGGSDSLMFNMGKSDAKVYVKSAEGIKFADVAGEDEAKENLTEIVNYLHDPSKYQEIGASMPKGVLLVGPPGTGKTMLAKAVAGEANVPFFSISGSDFVEMFVGVGASRVRDLFKEAAKVAPCIIFIDEIDTIGKSRDGGRFGGNDEREQTLNQLLAELDGFDPSKGVIVLGATNRPEVLDKALLRPGRFDRRITVDRPNLAGRLATLQVHTRNIRLAEDVNLDKIAQATAGCVGADLANLVNEAALRAVRLGRSAVNQNDLLAAFETVIAGSEKKGTVITDEEKRVIAYHEAGHATVSWILENASPLIKVTIIPRGKALGAAWYLPEERQITTREQMMDELAATLGGRVSEQLTFGEISTGALNDLERVTKQAYAMVAYYGMSENVGTLSFYDSTGQSDMAFTKPYSELTAQQIDAEAKQVIEKAYKMAEKVLREHADGLKELAELLLSREVVFTEDVERIFGRRKKDIERERREAEAKARAEGGKPAGEEPQAGKQAAAVADPSAKSDKSETAEPAPVAPAVAAPETE